MTKLSVVLAVRNEEANIGRCLEAIKNLASEIVIFDEKSTDSTVQIAKSFGARIYQVNHEDNFHVTKQKAIKAAKGDWILQLDADEVVTPELANEIKQLLQMPQKDVLSRPVPGLFKRHQKAIEDRDGKIGNSTSEVVAFFIPRRNIFLGKALVHAGVYPDAVVRLFKKDRAYLPAKSVHEQMVVDGQVSWLINDLTHYDSPTIRRYLQRLNRYTDLHAKDLEIKKIPDNALYFILYTLYKPLIVFLKLYLRHAGFKDGIRGFLWSAFSAMHYPIAYYKYLTKNNE